MSGACEAAWRTVEEACGPNFRAYVDACYPVGQLSLIGPIKRQCIGG